MHIRMAGFDFYIRIKDDFDARFDDELASYRDKDLYDLLNANAPIFSKNLNVVSELTHRALEENATVAQDQEEYEKKYAELEARYNVAEKGFHEAEERIEKQRARNRLLCQMTRQLKDLAGPLAEFDAGLWGVFVEQVTVLADRSMVVRFKDGTEIPVQPDKVGGNAS